MQKFKWKSLIGLIIGWSVLHANTAAASDMQQVVGVVDINKIVSQSKHTMEIKADMKKRYESRFKAIVGRTEAIEKRVKLLEKNKPTLSKDAYNKRKESIEKDAKKLLLDRSKYEKELASEQKMVEAKLISQLRKVVGRIAVEENMVLVLPKHLVIYSLPNSDITEKVRDVYESAYQDKK